MNHPDVEWGAETQFTGSLGRRRFLQGLLGVGCVRNDTFSRLAQAARPGVAIEFDDCQTAVVTNADTVETISVYYARHDGTRGAHYDIPATVTDLYSFRPLLVRYSGSRHRTTVRLAAHGSLVRVVADGSAGERTALTNDVSGCASTGYNDPPTAEFTAATASQRATGGESLVVTVDEAVVFTSTAADPDLPTDRVHLEWDLDGDGVFEAAGQEVTTTYTDAGPFVAKHRVTDDFDETSTVSLTIDVRCPWMLVEKLAPTELESGDQFGLEVVVSGDTLVASAPGDDDKAPNAGTAYMFDLRDLTHAPTKLTPASLHSGDLTGLSVAITGEVLTISAACDDEAGTDAGALYVYDLTDLTRSPTKLVPDSLDPGDLFGYSVALSDDTLVVGTIGDDERGLDAGAVYCYDLTDLSLPPTKLTSERLAPGDLFGFTVALADDTLAVGAIFDDERGDDAGAVYVFER